MIYIALLAASISHTPGYLFDTCNSQVPLTDVNVSQVHYMRLKPECTYMFVPDTCRFQTISLHRFKTGIMTAELSITSATGVTTVYRENMQEKHGEPFTSTPYITTIELNDVSFGKTGCHINVTGTGIASFVVGKAEDWWLGLTIPYWAYRIQWQWVYGDTEAWFWPFLVYIAYAFQLSFKYSIGHRHALRVVQTLLVFSLVVDFLYPSMYTAHALRGWPSSAIWNILFGIRCIIYWVLAYTVARNEYKIQRCGYLPMGSIALRSIPWFVFYIFTVFTGIGAYILVPMLLIRYGIPTRSS